MQTNDQQKQRHEHGMRQQLLYAGVTLAALSTGLMVSAHSAQAATVAEDSSLVAQKKVNNQDDQQEQEQPNVDKPSAEDDQPGSQDNQKQAGSSDGTSEQSDAAPVKQAAQPAGDAGQPANSGTTGTPAKPNTSAESPQPVKNTKATDESDRVSATAGFAKFSRSRVMSRMMAMPATVAVKTPSDTTDEATTDDGFTYALNATGDGYTITGYTGSATDIVIPDTHLNDAGKSINVSAIADNVFKGRKLTSLVMGAHVATIGQEAFEDNLLTTIDFSKNKSDLWGIGANAFADNKLTGTLTLPASITQIGEKAFAGSDANDGSGNQLTGVDFGDNLKTVQIGKSAFAYNSLKNLVLPVGTTTIGEMAFANNQLASVSLGTKLTTIGASAFNTNHLTTVNLPDLVTTVGPNAFDHNQLTSIHLDDALTTIGAGSFEDNQLVSVVIPDKVTTIGESAFTSNGTLTNLVLGKMVNTIGATAFAGDAITGNLFIPDSVETISQSAFMANQITGLTIGDGASKLATIDNQAFLGNPTLTGALILSDNMSFIGSNAFVGDSLTSIDFGKWEKGPNGDTTIGDGAFSGNKLTGTLTLADGIQHIGSATFAANQLTGLKLGTDLLTIGSSAFAANNQLTGTLTIPDLVTSIGDHAFTNGKLTGLILGQKVDTIGSSAFAENQLAGTLEIPNSVTSIGDAAFASNKLQALQLNGTVNSVGDGAFGGNNLQKIQAAQPVTNLGDKALAGQKTLDVTVNKSGNQLTGIRATIAKQLQLQNFALTDPMIFMLDDTPVTYDPTTDALTLPANFKGTSLKLSLSSGTTGDATEHSGNYGVDALTLSWSTPSSGSGTTTPTTPTDPGKSTTPAKPNKPATPTRPTTPNKPTNKVKPTKHSPKEVPSRKTKQHRTRGTDVNHSGQRESFKLAGSAAFTAFSGAQHGMSTSAWSYSHQATVVNRGSRANRHETQAQTQLPQTLEKGNYWSAVGTVLLAVLTWLGLGERRRRQ